MSKTREEVVLEILKILLSRVPDIKAAAVVDTDGLPIASEISKPAEGGEDDDPGVDLEVIGAMSAAMLSIGERSVEELNRGEFEHIYIAGTEGSVLMTSCGPEGVLVIVAKKKAKLGLMLLDIRRASAEITKLL
jgi:predicted regulator of Ras-like GTPase activity (Roadblock/LC7/MglB family)